MVTMGIFFPLQGWMMAIDGILIGARDYRYLAVTCTLTAVVYVTLILILANMVTPALTSDLMRTAVSGPRSTWCSWADAVCPTGCACARTHG